MLRKVAAEYAQSGIDEPKVSIKASFVNLWQTKEYANIKALEAVGLCDTVTVIMEQDLSLSQRGHRQRLGRHEYRESCPAAADADISLPARLAAAGRDGRGGRHCLDGTCWKCR